MSALATAVERAAAVLGPLGERDAPLGPLTTYRVGGPAAILARVESTPDLAVVQSSETGAGSVLMFLQYTVSPGSDAAMLIDEKVLLGSLQAGTSTITLRGMVPDRANVESEFEQIETIISTLSPDR